MVNIYKTLELELLINSASISNLSSRENRNQNALDLSSFFYSLITDFLKPDYFFEIGAFNAEFSRRIKPLLPDTKIFAFEANPYNYKKFESLVSNAGVEYIHSAISNEVGTVTFNLQQSIDGVRVDPIRGNNSLLERNQEAVDYEKITVPCDTVDNRFSTLIEPGDTIAMWIDVEGMAYQVFDGADSILSHTKIILVELEDRDYWENQHLSTDIIERLYHKGFLPIARDFEWVGQYNVIFVHNDLLGSYQFKELLAQYYSSLRKSSDNRRIISRLLKKLKI